MPRCKFCGAENDVRNLIRHEHGDLIIVHCPDCEHVLGTYNRRSEPPETDTLRSSRS